MRDTRSRPALAAARLLWLGCLGLLWPSNAWANPIVPPIAFVWPISWLALVPVILVEAGVACWVLGWRYGQSLRMAAVANFFSTLVGVPIGSCLVPLPFLSYLGRWWFPPAMVIGLYGLSVVSEAFVADQFREPDAPRLPLWRWALIANALSYLLILAALAVLLPWQSGRR